MGAEQLRAWEVILTSPVAASLLLLAAVFALGAIHLAWIRGLIRENRQLHQWVREHLEAEAGVSRVLDDLRPLLELIGERAASDRTARAPAPGALAGVAGPPPAGSAPGAAALPGDGGPAGVAGGGP